jgi:hypothetical protein
MNFKKGFSVKGIADLAGLQTGAPGNSLSAEI